VTNSVSVSGEVVDQILIATSATGSSVLATSLGSPAEEGFWLGTLRDRAPLPSAPGLYRPGHALTFLQLRNGGSAVLHRTAARTHALVSRGRMLTTETAIGLDSWPGWQFDGTLEPIADAVLQRHADESHDPLIGRTERVRTSVVTVVAALLGSWSAPVTIAGCPDEDRVAIVWALRQIGRRERERRAMRCWTFSTYELTDDDPVGVQPFEIVFLAAKPDSAAGRLVVDLSPFGRDRHAPTSEARMHAAALVDELLAASPATATPPYAWSLPPEDVADETDAEPVAASVPWLPIIPVRVPAAPPTVPAPAPAAPVRMLRCPTCADEIPWGGSGKVSVWDDTGLRYEEIDVGGMDARKRADILRRGYRRCPNPSGDTPEHYLPATYADYDNPLVIGLVGLSSSGKTHLLTAMIREAYRGGLQPFGVRTTALDLQRHASFRTNYIKRFDRGDVLPGTGAEVVDAADIMLLRGPGGAWPVTFFDVAGETLVDHRVQSRAARFLLAVNAVIFVHAPGDPGTGPGPEHGENVAFDLAMERISASLGSEVDIPAAIALTKSDRLRFVPPADRWLRRGTERELDSRRIRAESRDVFAYLHTTGALAALSPFSVFPKCTLHFVSASGGDASGTGGSNRFHRGVRPMRVLEPLISILAMTGFLAGSESEKVGAP
jgi:hypothetical protein